MKLQPNAGSQYTRLPAFAVVVGLLITAIYTLGVFNQVTLSPHISRLLTKHSTQASAGLSGAVSGGLFSGEQQVEYAGPRMFVEHLRASSHSKRIKPLLITQSKKWAVCTTIFKASKAVRQAAQLPGWSIVVVSDRGAAPFNYSAPNLVFLDVTDQEQLADTFGGIIDQLPWRHFGRKNVGYLYAIASGAELIWDFDDDNELKHGVEPSVPSDNVFNAQRTHDCAAFNPYPSMGGPSAADPKVPPSWPRGFPLDLIRKPCSHSLVPGNASGVAVVQSLADHDPDVDGIFRLTRGVPFSFDPGYKRTVVIPKGMLTPWNAQATLFLRPAFWSLLLPVSVHGRVSDIWRSYISQRLLWDVGHKVAFAPPMVDQFRSPHNYLADMQAEEDLYYKSGRLVDFLTSWQSNAPTLVGRYEELMIELYRRQYIQLEDVTLTQAWLRALVNVGYRFPKVDPKSSAAAKTTLPRTIPRAHNWAVLVSSQASIAVAQQLAQAGWQVLVGADGADSGTANWAEVQGVYCLTLEEQQSLGYAISQYLRRSGYELQNVGYLFAIANGASTIYEASGLTALLQEHVPVLTCATPHSELTNVTSGLPCRGSYTVLDSEQPGVFNPYPLFGQVNATPAVLPAAIIDRTLSAKPCFTRKAAAPLIQQGLVNTGGIKFDPTSFSVVLPARVLGPMSSHNTLFLKDALWALLLPTTVPMRCMDAVRGVLMQVLLWDIGGNLAVLPPTAEAVINATSTSTRGTDNNTCPEVSKSIQALLSWNAPGNTLPERLAAAADFMVDQGLWEAADAHLVRSWISDLQSVGYTFPVIAEQATMPEKGAAYTSTAAEWLQGPLEHAFAFPQRWCTHLDKMLVVNFNRVGEYNSFQQMRLLHAAYRPLVAKVVFIGADRKYPPYLTGYMANQVYVDCAKFIQRNSFPGFFLYACAAKVMSESCVWGGRPCLSMLFINDDVVFDPCLLSRYNSSNIWFSSTWQQPAPVSQQQGWHWQEMNKSRPQTTRLQAALDGARGAFLQGVLTHLRRQGTHTAEYFTESQADAYYVPARLHAAFEDGALQLWEQGVISEAGIPTLLGVLRHRSGHDLDKFRMVWAFGQPRNCIDANHSSILVEQGINSTFLTGVCKAGMTLSNLSVLMPADDDASPVFAIHPFKLSVPARANWWLGWWMRSKCGGLSPQHR